MEYSLARNWWVLALRGVLAILFGVLVFFLPILGWLMLIASFAAYALVDGVFAIMAAVSGHGEGRKWWALALEGLLGISAGVITLLWPALTMEVLFFVIAGWAMATGVFQIVAAIRLRKVIEGEWVLALSGILSILFGVTLALFPGPGSLAIALLIGVYSVAFGVLFLAVAFRLRSLLRETSMRGRAMA